MNVYDFDKTIYKKDSSVQFYKYVIKKRHSIFFRCIVPQLCAVVLYYAKIISKEKFKEKFFCFFKHIDACNMANEFAKSEIKNINEWYLKQKRNNDVIISASPDFLVKAFMTELGVNNVIGSQVEPTTGFFLGKNCYGEEKYRRFIEVYGDEANIEEFYSDSLSDLPMATKANKAYMIKKGQIISFF